MNWFLMAFKKYAIFKGRSGQKEFWIFISGSIFIIALAAIIEMFAGLVPKEADSGLFSLIAVLALFLPVLAVTVRRLHDVDKSGWFLFLIAIPLVGAIILLIKLCADGNPGENQYGANPKKNI